jgi:hypothetical protein
MPSRHARRRPPPIAWISWAAKELRERSGDGPFAATAFVLRTSRSSSIGHPVRLRTNRPMAEVERPSSYGA